MENAQKIGAARDSNPGPRGFVVFRAALVTARTDGKSLTLVGKQCIQSETVKFVKKMKGEKMPKKLVRLGTRTQDRVGLWCLGLRW